MDNLTNDIKIVKDNISILERGSSQLVSSDGKVVLDPSDAKMMYLPAEYELLESLTSKYNEVLHTMNNFYFNTVGNIHYLVKLGYSMKELQELPPVELMVLQYKVHEIEEEIAKTQRKILESNGKGVAGDANV